MIQGDPGTGADPWVDPRALSTAGSEGVSIGQIQIREGSRYKSGSKGSRVDLGVHPGQNQGKILGGTRGRSRDRSGPAMNMGGSKEQIQIGDPRTDSGVKSTFDAGVDQGWGPGADSGFCPLFLGDFSGGSKGRYRGQL